MATFAAVSAAVATVARARGRTLRQVGPLDLALMAVSTFKLARLVTKDLVTQPVRAPFTEPEGPAGDGEVNERPAGQGLRRVIGELVSCPFCASVWTATGLAAGVALAPDLTRAVMVTATSAAGADFLQLAYARARQGVD